MNYSVWGRRLLGVLFIIILGTANFVDMVNFSMIILGCGRQNCRDIGIFQKEWQNTYFFLLKWSSYSGFCKKKKKQAKNQFIVYNYNIKKHT